MSPGELQLEVREAEAPLEGSGSVVPAVVVPSFNHGGTLISVVERSLARGFPVIVVDDGSTDGTAEQLARWVAVNPSAGLEVVTHSKNLGKAAALQSGFGRGAMLGATHVATVDADGQLDPEDIPRLLEVAARHPTRLILGSRPRQMDGCPSRCNLGRRLTSLAVAVQSGVRLSDTQCGLRVYPLELLQQVKCGAGRYAFESEVITRAAWAGYGIEEVAVNCKYFTGAARSSHYRPIVDSVRQAALHVYLLGLALLPFGSGQRGSAGAKATPWQRCMRVLSWLNPVACWRDIRSSDLGRLELSTALALGAWIGTLPFYGFHTLMCAYTAWRLHLRPAAMILGSQISMPPIGVGLAIASAWLGNLMLTGEVAPMANMPRSWSAIRLMAEQWLPAWLLGSVVLGFVLAVAIFVVSAAVFNGIRPRDRHAAEREARNSGLDQDLRPVEPA